MKSSPLLVLAFAVTASQAQTPPKLLTTNLDQNWSPAERTDFWFRSQGSRLMPYRWFLHLEQASGEKPFRDPAHLDGLRFIAAPKSPLNPDALPIGVTRDGNYVGLTCAACHTAQLILDGKPVIVEGGPTMLDFQTFLGSLVDALAATLGEEPKFKRFVRHILGASPTSAQIAALKKELTAEYEDLRIRRAQNTPKYPYGYARLDAFGHIFNRLTAQVIRGKNGQPMPQNRVPPDAPVSYPVLWDTPQHDRVQWNGSAPNGPLGLGALGRNIGECIGVFGRMEIKNSGQALPGLLPVFPSTIRKENLVSLEGSVRRLWSPKWPYAIDETKRKAGAALYAERCISCHKILKRASPLRTVRALVKDVGTDPSMWQAFLKRKAESGVLENAELPFRDPLLAEEPAAVLLEYAVQGVLNPLSPNSLLVAGSIAEPVKAGEIILQGGRQDPARLSGYKARPLNGVWASAPYLHNGSVPTLRDMLKPPADRPTRFHVGSRVFDPVHVGFSTSASTGSFEFDTTLPGNLNTGHDHTAGLTDEQRDQLLEFLKTVGEEK